MSTPLVSIVIPVFNRCELISDCIESALAQTYSNIEIIVSDNCSIDGTQAIVNRYALDDPRVRLIENSENIGPVRNWLRGLQFASGTYCRLLFSDDLLHPTAVEKQVVAMFDSFSEAALSSVIVGSLPWKGDVLYKRRDTMQHINSRTYIVSSLLRPGIYPVSPCAFLFRRERYCVVLELLAKKWADNVEFMQTGAGIDLLSILEYFSANGTVVYLDEPLVFFRSHQNSITIGNINEVRCLYHKARYQFVRDRFGPNWERFYRWLVCAKTSLTHWRTQIRAFLLPRRNLGQ
jgi:glycosyltransferase involved in cell wall biosynthesis